MMVSSSHLSPPRNNMSQVVVINELGVLFSSASSVDAHHNNHYSSHSSHVHQAIPASHHNHSSSYTGIARTGVLCCPSPRWPTPSSTTESVNNNNNNNNNNINNNVFITLYGRSLMNDSKDVNNAITSIPVHHPLPVLHRQMFQLPVGFPVAQGASIHLLTCSTVIAIIICQTRRFFSYD